jgi:hypothetical protein
MGPQILVNIQPAVGPGGGGFVVGAWQPSTQTLWGVEDIFEIAGTAAHGAVPGIAHWAVNNVTWQPANQSLAASQQFPENASIWFSLNAAPDEFYVQYCGLDGSVCYPIGQITTVILPANNYFLGCLDGGGAFYVRFAGTATQLDVNP